jgi:DNA-binding GntR family transcriptional regulator
MMNRAQNLASEAHRRILTMMFEGTLKPGDALREAALGTQLGMSRTPVREAIKRLESEGLATPEGRSTRVRRMPFPEIEEVFFLRLALEPALARSAVRLPPERLDQMEHRIRALMRAGPDYDDTHWQTDNDFHDLLAESSGNQTARAVLQALRQRTCVFDHKVVPERFLQGCTEHLAILEAVRRGNPEAVQAELCRHLEHARDAVLQRLRRVQDRT